MTKGEDCTVGATHTAEIQTLQRLADENREDHNRMWETMDRIERRLPLWATMLISVLMTLCGILATIAAK